MLLPPPHSRDVLSMLRCGHGTGTGSGTGSGGSGTAADGADVDDAVGDATRSPAASAGGADGGGECEGADEVRRSHLPCTCPNFTA